MSEHGAADAQGAAGEGGETLYWAAYTVLERTGRRPQDADSAANREAFDALVADHFAAWHLWCDGQLGRGAIRGAHGPHCPPLTRKLPGRILNHRSG